MPETNPAMLAAALQSQQQPQQGGGKRLNLGQMQPMGQPPQAQQMPPQMQQALAQRQAAMQMRQAPPQAPQQGIGKGGTPPAVQQQRYQRPMPGM